MDEIFDLLSYEMKMGKNNQQSDILNFTIVFSLVTKSFERNCQASYSLCCFHHSEECPKSKQCFENCSLGMVILT